MTIKHLLYVPFTGLGLRNGYRGDQWLRNRIKVFLTFVIPSLIHQSNRNFTLWLQFRPEDEGNPDVLQLESTLQTMRDLSVIFTYGGLCFEDDKYDRPVSLQRLEANLARTMPILAPIVANHDVVLMTIQPSDDMYLSKMVEETQARAKSLGKITTPQSCGYREGYMINMNTLELAEYAKHDWKTDDTSTYTTNTIPPFFTVMFPRDIFLDAKAHTEWTGPYRSHEYIGEHTKYHILPGRGFIVGTHGENISTTWHHRYKGRMIEGEEKEKILFQVGLYQAEPIKLEKDLGRKVEQRWINLLPKALRRKWEHMRSPGLGSAIDNYNYFHL